MDEEAEPGLPEPFTRSQTLRWDSDRLWTCDAEWR
jgi:hypothetical protein